MISIVTATYNRAHLLPRLYESLQSQENKDFEWVVVNDGSVDNTENLIMEFMGENLININYIKKNNGGKHTALNIGIEAARYDYIFFVDSDDVLPVNSISVICDKIDLIKNHKNYNRISGVCGSKAHLNGQLTGTTLNKDLICNYLEFRYLYNITGDKAEVFKKKVLKEFKFPEFEGEKFCPEALVWNRIAKKYNMYFFDDVVYLCEYQSGGLTDKIFKIRKESPNSTLLYYMELYVTKNISRMVRMKALINFWRFYEASDKEKYLGNFPKSILNFMLEISFKVYFSMFKLVSCFKKSV